MSPAYAEVEPLDLSLDELLDVPRSAWAGLVGPQDPAARAPAERRTRPPGLGASFGFKEPDWCWACPSCTG